MGSLRFILACLVLLSHLGISLYGLNPGVSAVVVFYLLAGHVVARLWQQWKHEPYALFHFYRDRCWRIFPQYAVAVAFAALLWLNGAQSSFISVNPSPADWAANTLIIPLNYYMYTGQDNFTLIPPAWSLGTEIQFYLIAPFLLSQKLSRIITWCVISLAIFTLAQLQWLNTDHYGYRLIPGILFIFLTGALQELSHRHIALSNGMTALWILNVFYLLWLFTEGTYRPYNREVSFGLMAGMPLLALLDNYKQCERKASFGANMDKKLGALSYGVFLYHFPVIWLMQPQPSVSMPKDIISIIVLTISCAAIGHWYIERPLWRRFR